MEDRSIRIAGGQRKGKKLKSLPGLATRPIMRRVKQSLFDILGTKIEGSSFLDLYAGTGSVGIEALSRGAKNAVFVEKERGCTGIIKTNLHLCSFEERAEVVEDDITDYFRRHAKFRISRVFDFIFIGPPYKENVTASTISVIDRICLLRESGWIISQHHVKEKIDRETGGLHLFRQEKYGKTMLSFYRYE